MKKFTKLIRVMMVSLLSFTFLVGYAQNMKPTNLSSDKLQVSAMNMQNMTNVSEIPAAEIADGVFTGQVSYSNSKPDLSTIASYGGPSDAVLYNNGPFVTNPGGGAGGADLSALQTNLGMATLGANFNWNADPTAHTYFYMADDFVVTGIWAFSTMKFYGYQTNSGNTSTMTGVYVQIWNGDPSLPGSTVVYGNLSDNIMLSTSWSNCYRAAITTPTNVIRPVMEIVADMSGCELFPGTYWVQVGATGSLASGPWVVPISIIGTPITGNAKAKTSTGWVDWTDTGTGLPAQGLPFIIDGSIVTCPSPIDLTTSDITINSAKANWTESGSATVWNLEWGLPGFIPGTGTYVGTATINGAPTQYVMSPLALSTDYEWYVRADCGIDETSIWKGPAAFKTLCEVICVGTAEGEAQTPNDGTEVTNGGCNMASPLFESINLGETYCGQTNTYTTGGGTGFARDTDWYRFDISSPTCNYWNVTITAVAEFDLQVLLIDAGDDNCTNYSIIVAQTAGPCETITISDAFPSGIYYIWMGPQTALDNPYPFGGGPYEYSVSLAATMAGAPEATINPTSFEVTVPPEQTVNVNLTIGNTGSFRLDYLASTTGTTAPMFSDNFDLYTAGVQLASQNPVDWTTWSGTPGSTEDPFVSADVANTGPNSVLITGVNDCVHTFPNYTAGNWKISFYMYVPSGFDGYFNTLQLFAGASSEWGMQAYFDAGGVASIDAGASAAATWDFTYDTWMYNELFIDLNNDWAIYVHNGVEIVAWQWSTGSFGSGTLKQLGGNNFYAYVGTQTPKFYIDDYKFEAIVNDWLTLNGSTSASGSILVGGANQTITLALSSVGKPIGSTYNKVIALVTNELCADLSYTIPVTMYVGYQLSGNVYYGDLGNTKPQVTSTSIALSPQMPPPDPITVPAGAGGAFMFRPLDNDTYGLIGASGKPWGGLNAPDASFAQQYILGTRVLTNLQKRAADINLSGTVQSLDVTMMKRRILGQTYASWIKPNEFVWDGPFAPGWHGVSPTWVQTGLSVVVTGSNVVQNVRCLASGDVNESYTPLPNP